MSYVSPTNFNNVYHIESKYTDIPSDAILFFLPTVSSNDANECKLEIKFPLLPSTQNRYVTKTYTIVVETNSGATRKCTVGDIIANRMCIFRFKVNSNEVILCNSPLYNDAIVNNLQANEAVFNKVPYVKDENNVNNLKLVTTAELRALEKRISDLESKIAFGDGDPTVELADKPAGSVYFQYEGEI